MNFQEKINEFQYNDIKLEMFWSGKTNSQGRCQMEYKFWQGETLLQQRNDFCLSPLHYPDSIDAVISLLGFLIVREGDTDNSHFKFYSPEMMAWTRSNECEYLSLMVSDYENDGSLDAIAFFNEHSKINVA